MNIRNILLLIVYVSIVSACGQSHKESPMGLHAMKVVKPWIIRLLVTGNGDNAAMKVNTGPMQNCFSTDNGCMFFEKGEIGVVPFKLSGNDQDFYITELKLCKGATPPAPLNKDCELDQNANDFYAVDSNGDVKFPDKNTGKIEWPYDDSVKMFVLSDQNSLTQKYYYMVIACDGADPATRHCVTADPPLDNHGSQ